MPVGYACRWAEDPASVKSIGEQEADIRAYCELADYALVSVHADEECAYVAHPTAPTPVPLHDDRSALIAVTVSAWCGSFARLCSSHGSEPQAKSNCSGSSAYAMNLYSGVITTRP